MGLIGFGFVNSDMILRSTFLMVKAGDHFLLFLKMSIPISPFELIFGWNTFVSKVTFGGMKG